jgi:outer membrane protein
MNHFKKFYLPLLFTLLILGTSAIAEAQEKFTLTQAIEHAKKENTAIKNARLDIKIAEQEVKSVIASGLPQINAGASFMHNIEIPSQVLPDFLSPAIYGVLMDEGLIPSGPINLGASQTVQFGAPSTLSGSVTLNQLVFDGTYFLGLKAAKEYVNVRTLSAERSTIDVIEGVTKTYYLALFADRNVKLMQESRTTIATIHSDMKKMFENGLAEQLDVDRLELALSTLDAQIKTVEASRVLAYKSLKLQMGIPVDQSIELEVTEIETAANNIVETEADLNKRIEHQMLEQAITLDKMNVKRYKVGYIPSVGLQFQHQQNSFASAAEFEGLGKVWNPGTFYVLNLQVPVFDGFYKKAKIQQAKIQLQKDENSLLELSNGLKLQKEQAVLSYQTQSANFDTRTKNKELASSIFNQTKSKFDAGMGSSFELTQAQSDMTTADIGYSNALYQLIVSKVELQKALGLLK